MTARTPAERARLGIATAWMLGPCATTLASTSVGELIYRVVALGAIALALRGRPWSVALPRHE